MRSEALSVSENHGGGGQGSGFAFKGRLKKGLEALDRRLPRPAFGSQNTLIRVRRGEVLAFHARNAGVE